ncbi:hypothetical protein QFC21_004056 [Naganishia friedmannii]|uniref:Uncharacterized protein n=1 Tax=Naganishia friedmannii TaxID=89922 RepID=A0ACC2VKN6_9TREE|nr:hypothetical protein QFC21_004056 [Naganishia friedmannii]
MLIIRPYIPKLYARAGAPTSGLIPTTTTAMSVASTAVRASSTSVRETTAVVSTLAKASTTSLKLNTPIVSSTTSLVRDVVTSVTSKVSLVVATPTRSSTTTATSTSKSSSGISGGAVAGIIIGVLVAGLVAAIFLYRMIQRRRRANRRMTGGLQAWTDRTSYFSASGSGSAGVGGGVAGREEREMGAGQVPFREMQDKDQDGGPWVLEEKGTYHEPIMMAGVPSGNAYDQQQHHAQQVYPQPYSQQRQQQTYQQQLPQHPYSQPLDHTPIHLSQPQGYPMTPSPGPGTPNTFGGVASPTLSGSTGMLPAQMQGQGLVIQDEMNVVVRQGFVRTLEDELVIAPGDNLFVVQAYDDGWCLCRSVHNEQGVVPQSCLSPVVVSPFSEAAKRTSVVPMIQMPLPAVVVSGDGGLDEMLAPTTRTDKHSAAAEEEMKTLAPPLASPLQQQHRIHIRHFGTSFKQVKDTIAEAFMTAPLPLKDGMNATSTGSSRSRMGEERNAGRRIQCWGHRGASGTSLRFLSARPRRAEILPHVRTKKQPVQPIPTFEQLIALIMEVDCKIQNDPETLFPQMAKIISIAFPMLMNGAGAGSGGGEKFMEDCKKEGKEICVWTVNTAEEMRWCARWGVKAIITDRVAYCVSVREQIMLLRWVEDNLQRNAFRPGPLKEVDLSRVLEDKAVMQEREDAGRVTE